MPDPDTRAADELRARERFLYLGCAANLFLGIALIVGVVFLTAQAFQRGEGREPHTEAPQVTADEAQIRGVLDAQVAAWNRGDLDGFMAGYWRDEQLTFMSGDRVTRGWEATRARYQKKYFTPDKDGKLAERGELGFEELHVENLSPTAAVVRGRYVLKLANETATGRFTLVFRKLPDGWKITSDHTSAADPPPPGKK